MNKRLSFSIDADPQQHKAALPQMLVVRSSSREGPKNEMLSVFKRRIAEGFLVAVDVAGIALSGSGAAVVAVFGKFMLAVVLGAIALGFFLRLAGRRRTQIVASPPTPMWLRGVSAVVAVVEVGLLVEATNFPVRFDQAGFEPWHWALVLVALAVAYPLNLRVIGWFGRRRRVTAQP